MSESFDGNDIRDTVRSVENVPFTVLVLGVVLGGSAVIAETIYTSVISQLSEQAVITSAAVGSVERDVFETAVIDSRVSASNVSTRDVRDTARVTDVVVLATATTEDSSEQALLGDYSDYVLQPTDARDVGALSATADSSTLSVSDVWETAVVSDVLYIPQPDPLRDVGALSSTLSWSARLTQDSRESALVGDWLTITGNLLGDTRDVAALSDAVYLTVDSTADLQDRAAVTSWVSSSTPERSWTANMQTWAMSYYTGLNITSAAGSFGASPDGVYVRGTGPVDMTMESGRIALVDERPYQTRNRHSVKMVPRMYAHFASASPLALTVTSETRGVLQSVPYTIPATNALEPVPQRVKLALGAQGMYWTYVLANTNGAAVKLHHIDLTFAERKRGNP